MKKISTYLRDNSFFNYSPVIKCAVLLCLTIVLTINKGIAQCGPGAAVQVAAPPTGASDAMWTGVFKNIIGANPNNTVTNDNGHVPPVFTSDGFPLLGSPTAREADFGTPTWQAVWTTTALYILVTVPDDSVNFDPIPNDPFFYNYDAVEVYLSGSNAHAGPPYGPDDVQYGFSGTNSVYRGFDAADGGSGSGSSTAGVTNTAITTSGVGYTEFITIPLSSFTSPTAMNSQVSFDVAIDDNDHTPNITTQMSIDSAFLRTVAGGSYPAGSGPGTAQFIAQGFRSGGDWRDAQVAWNSTTNQAPYSTTSDLGNLKLTAPPTPATAHNQSICGSGIITLAGNAPAVGVGQWIPAGGMASLADIHNPLDINNPTGTFFSAGIGSYVFTWSILNSTCSAIPSTANDSISVTPLPLLFITDPLAACSPATVDITAPAVTAGSTVGTVFTYFTDATTTTPVATPTAITTSGTYYIQSTSTSNCITTNPVNVVVNSSPVITVTAANTTACSSSTGSFTVNGLTPGVTYTIGFDKAGIAQTPQTLIATAAGTATVSGLPADSYTNIIATPPAGCTSNAATATIADPAPPVPVASSAGVCSGNSLLLSTTPSGATYSWTGPNGFTSTAQSPVISPATAADSGVYTVVVTVANCNATTTVVGVVRQTPVLVITNPAAVCAPAGIDITTGAVTAGSTLPAGTSLSYYTNAGATTTVGTPTNITLNGTYYIKAATAAGCADTAAVIVTINPKPAIAVTEINPTACLTSTGSFTISGLIPGATYIVNFDSAGIPHAPKTFIATATGTIPVGTLASGSYTNITVTSAAGCISNAVTTTLSDPSAPVPVASSGGVCSGNSLSLTTTPSGATYSWTGPNGFTSTAQSPVISPATAADSGLYSVTVTVAGCIGTTTVVGAVHQTPILVITNPAAVCAPAGINITTGAITAGSTLPPGTVLGYYTNPGATTTVGTPTNITLNGTYYIKAATAAGCADTAAVTVTINPKPAITVTEINPTACLTSTGSFTISGLIPGATYIINFDSAGIPHAPKTFIATATGTIPVGTLAAGSYTNITVTSTSGCVSNAVTTTLTDPSAPVPVASAIGVCSGNSLSLNTTPSGATYSWTGPNGFTSTVQNPVISPATAADSGLYTVVVTVAGCVSTTTVVGAVHQTPILVITNPAAVCAPAGIDITAGAITAGSTLPPGTVLGYYTNPGATTTVGTPTNITLTGTYYIKAATAAGCADTAAVTVTVNPKPAITITKINPTACSTSTGSFTIAGLIPGATYIINFDSAGIPHAPETFIATATGTIPINTLAAGNYTNITVTSTSGCTSNIVTATLADPTAPTTTAGTGGPICSGGTLTLTSTTIAGATYSWTGPNGFSSAAANTTISPALYADSGSYTVTITVAGCIGTSSVVGVIHPTPVLVITNPTVLCSFVGVDITAPTITAGSTLPSGTILTYYTDATLTTLVPTPTNVTSTGTYYVKAVSPSNCSDVKPIVVMISALPPITVTETDPTACSTSTGSFTINGLTPGIVYTVNFDKAAVAQPAQVFTADAAGTITVAGLSAGSYTNIMASVAAGCVSNIGSATLSDPAAPTPTAGTGGPVCSGNTLSLTSSIVGAIYSWTGPNGFTSAQQNPTIPSALYADSGSYTVAVTVVGCTGTASVVGVVHPTPILTITNPAAICAPAGVDITLPAITAGSTLPSGTTLNYYSDAIATTAIATPTNITANGTYYITAISASGCSDTAAVMVTINPLPILTITNPAGVCSPGTVDITAAAVTTGSTAGTVLSYYSNALATTAVTIPSAIAASNTYYIKSTTPSGCSDTAAVIVTINPLPVLTITNPAGVCSPGTTDITLPAITTGSTAGTTLSYYSNALATTSLTTPTAIALNGTYYIEATTPAGCNDTAAVVVTINPLPLVTITNPAGVCSPSTVDITAPAITAGSTTGTTLSYYSNALATAALSTPTAIAASNTYYIKSTTPLGCSDTSAVVVTINPLPVLAITDPAVACSPSTVDITAAAITAGSTAGTTLSYYTNAIATNPITVAAAQTIGTSGTYYIRSTTASGCSDTAATVVKINPTPALTIQNPNAVCAPSTVDITNPSVAIDNSNLPAGTVLSYYYDAGATSPIAVPEEISTTNTYYIVATAANCSSAAKGVTVTIHNPPTPPVTENLHYCQFSDVPALTADGNSGNTLVWYTQPVGGNDSSFTAPVPATNDGDVTLRYYVGQAQTFGSLTCVSTSRSELDVRITTQPTAAVSPSNIEVYAGDPVTFQGSATGGPITWTVNDSTGASFSDDPSQTLVPPSSVEPPIDITTYYLVVVSPEFDQCKAVAAVTVKTLQPLLIPNIFSPNGDGTHDVWVIKNIQEFDNAEVSIFNRYGQFIYKSSDGYKTPWDGTYHGDPVPVGTYFYIIKTTADAKPISGYVAVVR
jgi:gliding motility-associated-like protein